METDNTPLYRYPGTKPFEASESVLFNGRDEDIDNLYELISLENLIVLYSRSGLGKSSLLNAGLINKFSEEPAVAPVFIRFFNYYNEKPEKPFEKLYEIITRNRKQDFDNFLFQKLIPQEDITEHRLWYLFKSIQIADPVKNTFVLIFDQFEELFTYPEKDIEIFKKELSELYFVKVPQQLRNLLKEKLLLDKDHFTKEELQLLHHPVNIKILFAIRSDKLSLLNNLTDYFPSILKLCYELKPLNRRQAKDAIVKPAELTDKKYKSDPFTFTPDALKLILDSLSTVKKTDVVSSAGKQDIETFQLQIVCRYVENLIINGGISQVTTTDLGNVKDIFENHYRDIINKLSSEKQIPARRLIEEKLIIDGARVSMPIPFILKDEGMTKELLDELINTHIIRAEQNNTVEVSHDTLIEPVLKQRTNEYVRIKQQGDIFFKLEKYKEAIDTYSQYLETIKKLNIPATSDVYKARGDAYVKIKDYVHSNEDYECVLSISGDDTSVLYSIAVNYVSLGNDKKADEYFERAVELNPEYAAKTFNEIGFTYDTIKLHDRAKIYYEKAISKDPQYFEPHYNLGLLYYYQNNWENALGNLKKAIEVNPTAADGYNQLGNVYYALKDYENAKRNYEIALSIDPVYYYAFYNLGLIAVKSGNSDLALEYYQKAIDVNPGYELVYLQKAVLLGTLKRFSEAVTCLDTIIRINPNSAEAYSRLGLIYINIKDYENALKNLEKAISLEPTADSFYYLGLAYYKMGDLNEAVLNYQKTIKLDSDYEVAYEQLGKTLIELERYDEVIDEFEKIIDNVSSFKQVYIYLEQAYYHKKDYATAREYGLKAIKLDPDDYIGYVYLATLEDAEENFEDAFKYYQKIIQISPKVPLTYISAGKSLIKLNRYEEAITYFSKAIELDPLYADAYFNLGNAYFDTQEYEEARKNYEMAVSIDPKYFYSFYNLGLAETNIGNLEAAVNYYQKAIEINPQYWEAYLQLVNVLNKLEKFDESIIQLEKLININPSLDALIEIGNVYFNHKKDFEKAKEYYLTATKVDPKSEVAYLNLGLAEYKSGNTIAALENYQKAIDVNPQYSIAYCEIGNVKTDENNYEEAVGYFETAIKLNPNYSEAYNNLGHCYFNLNPFKKAQTFFRKAIEVAPNEKFIYITYNNLAEAQIKLGDYDEALESCKKSIELNPEFDTVYNNAGVASEKIGQIDTAIAYYQKSLQLNPANEEAKQHLGALKKVES